MIAYLDGPIHHLQTDRAIILAGGVGYLVHIPLSTYYRLEGKKSASLLIYTHVREDLIALYGFGTEDERTAFEKLISISGIGPRLAQVILSGIGVPDLADAIAKGDSRRLSSIPGLGKKTAERICLELRDKLVASEESGKAASTTLPVSLEDDVISALLNLGYRPAVANAALNKAKERIEGEPEFSELLRAALGQLTR